MNKLQQAIEQGSTMYFKKGKRSLAEYNDKHGQPLAVLKKVNNAKIKGGVKSGAFKSAKIFTLTLEERATCPKSCHHWSTCYGNNMPFAHRLEHGQELIRRIERDLVNNGDKPALVRLHVLGDFWSPEYVQAWSAWLDRFPKLAVWGYTHNWPDSPVKLERDIAQAIQQTRDKHGQRFAVRWSDRPDLPFSANSEDLQQPKKGKALICPQQLGKSDGCGDCTLCWDQPDRQIIFKTH